MERVPFRVGGGRRPRSPPVRLFYSFFRTFLDFDFDFDLSPAIVDNDDDDDDERP